MAADDILKLLAAQKAALAKLDAAEMARIIAAYKAMYRRLEPQIEALADVIAAMNATDVTVSQVMRMRRFIELKEAIEQELEAFAIYLKTDITPMALSAAKYGEIDSFKLMKYLLGSTPLIRADFDRIPVETLQAIMAFLRPDGALFQKLDGMSHYYADEVGKAILDAIGLGMNPRDTARRILAAAEEGFGRGLVDALRTARTVQLYGYREASRANYLANSDVVTGWVWVADLEGDPPPCVSCVAMHGTEHGLDENLDDHYNGRCGMIPMVMGQNPVEDMQGGEDWFGKQTEAKQQEMMGKDKWAAWKGGEFDFSQLSQVTEDPTYSHMHTETPLKVLLGED